MGWFQVLHAQLGIPGSGNPAPHAQLGIPGISNPAPHAARWSEFALGQGIAQRRNVSAHNVPGHFFVNLIIGVCQ